MLIWGNICSKMQNSSSPWTVTVTMAFQVWCSQLFPVFLFLDPCQSVGQWVSESVIVSDLEIAIAYPSFASLFCCCRYQTQWGSLQWEHFQKLASTFSQSEAIWADRWRMAKKIWMRKRRKAIQLQEREAKAEPFNNIEESWDARCEGIVVKTKIVVMMLRTRWKPAIANS